MATATDQERPKVRVPPSWIALVALAGAGVLGALYWLGPTWVRVNESLDGAVQERTISEEPAVTVPDAMFPVRRSVAPGQGSRTRGLSANPAVAVVRLQSEYGLKATGVFGVRSYMVLSKRVLGAKVPSVKARRGAPGEE